MLHANAHDVSNGTAGASAEDVHAAVTKVTGTGTPTAGAEPTLEERLAAAYAEECQRLVLGRLRIATFLTAMVTGLALPLFYVLIPDQPVEAALAVGTVLLCAVVAFAITYLPAAVRWASAIAAGYLSAVAPSILWLLSHPEGVVDTPGTLTVLLFAAVFTYPWGGVAQAAVSSVFLAGYVARQPWTMLPAPDLLRDGISLAAGALLSVVGAALLEQHRRDDFQRRGLLRHAAAVEEEERRTAESLLDVAGVLSTHIDRPDLPECMNRLFTTHLGTDWSVLYAWDGQHPSFCFAAQDGLRPDARDVAQSIAPSRETLSPLGDLRPGRLIEVEDTARGGFAAPDIMRRLEAASFLCVPIPRRDGLAGLVLTGYRDRTGPFSPRQRRLALGIASGAAVALETAHLITDTQEANRLKSEFVATMSHELRTPLNVITGYTDLLAEGVFGDSSPEQLDTLGRIRKNALELLELVNATLDLGRLEAGRETAELAPVAVSDVFAQIAAELQAMVPDRVHLRWLDGLGARAVLSDHRKLKTILKNLVGNALKFTPAGSVEVSARLADGALQLAVRDTGIGIAADHLPIIFDKFRQVDASSTRGFGGVGLGLHIVRRLVELLGGTIAVESRVGIGSTFHVRLPNVALVEERATGT